MIFRRMKAGGWAHCAIDIDGGMAPSADKMMVVVSHPGLVKGRSTGRFDSADDTRRNKCVKIVVHRLSR